MPLSASTHAAIGAVSGVIEVTLLHPTVAWKNALQEGRQLNLRPTALYRGYVMNVGSFAPITMAQFGVNRLLESKLSRTGDGASFVVCRASNPEGSRRRSRRLGSQWSRAHRRGGHGRCGVIGRINAMRADYHSAAGAHCGRTCAAFSPTRLATSRSVRASRCCPQRLSS